MENDPAAQLALVADARRNLADRLITPWWYHPALGAMLALYVVAFAFGSTIVRAATLVLFLAGCALLARAYRRLTGVWVSGFDAGPARRWAYALGGTIAALMLGGWLIAWLTDLVWPVWLAAAVLWVATVLLGRRFDAVLRADLRGSAHG
jgi:hypothetical protein